MELWEHVDVVDVCMGEKTGGRREEIIKILEDDGREETWMKKLQGKRKMTEEGRGEGKERRMTKGG